MVVIHPMERTLLILPKLNDGLVAKASVTWLQDTDVESGNPHYTNNNILRVPGVSAPKNEDYAWGQIFLFSCSKSTDPWTQEPRMDWKGLKMKLSVSFFSSNIMRGQVSLQLSAMWAIELLSNIIRPSTYTTRTEKALHRNIVSTVAGHDNQCE
jgi:hypothetical protein